MRATKKRALPSDSQNVVPADGAPRKQTINQPSGPERALDLTTLRGLFARSLCRAHHVAIGAERAACDDGQPCGKANECLKLADNTLMYLEYRNRMPETG